MHLTQNHLLHSLQQLQNALNFSISFSYGSKHFPQYSSGSNCSIFNFFFLIANVFSLQIDLKLSSVITDPHLSISLFFLLIYIIGYSFIN